jgi:hypothetical protein
MARPISIAMCNIALSEVKVDPIVTIDDDNPQARACAVHFDECVQLLLEAHDWGFARKRVALAPLVNDRGSEWLYAYATPSDMAATVETIRPLQTPLSGVYYPWPYLYPRPPFIFSDFITAGNVLYSNVDGAILEYISRDIEEAYWPQTFKRAVELALASRLAYALWQDRALKGDLMQQAEAEKRRAMAEDLNRYPRRDFPAPDEVAIVRSF